MGRKKGKVKHGPNRQPKASKPKFGRSASAFKPRTVSKQEWLRGTRKKFALLPFSKAFWSGKPIKTKGVENVSEAEKKNFLVRNKDVAVRAMAGGTLKASSARRVLSSSRGLQKLEGKTLNRWVVETQRAIVRAETANLERTIADHAKNYFKARQIPVKTEWEKIALDQTVNQLIMEKRLNLYKPLNLAWIEQHYLKYRREFKGSEQEAAVNRNTLFRKIFGQKRLTANQRRAAKTWILRNLPELEKERHEIIKRVSPGDGKKLGFEAVQKASEEYDKAEERFKKKARTELLKQFTTEKKAVVQQVRPANQRVKQGTRTQRMAAYKPREKTSTEKKNEMRKEAQKAKLAGKPFDSVAFAIKEIGFESRPTAVFLKGLLDKKLLKRDSLIRLFTSGSLTQRLFRTVVNDPEFRNRFGSSNIDRLARGVAFIGPTGKLTAKAMRAFQSEKGKKLFEFLARRGFIDTRHGKGMTVTYLARFKGQ